MAPDDLATFVRTVDFAAGKHKNQKRNDPDISHANTIAAKQAQTQNVANANAKRSERNVCGIVCAQL